jgi:hypothetical protein
MKVYSLLFCRQDKDLPTSLLFFSSLKVGFPNYEIVLVDNANPPKYKNIFKKKAQELGLKVQNLSNEISHERFVSSLIYRKTDPFYVIDPDTMYFESMEKQFDSPFAGRYIPKFQWKIEWYYKTTYALPKLHSCCMYIDPNYYKKLLGDVNIDNLMVNPKCFDSLGNTWWKNKILKSDLPVYSCDIMSEFYNHFPTYCHPFSEEENNKFLHMMCGSHFHLKISSSKYAIISKWQEHLFDDLKSNKNEYGKSLYKIQDDFFKDLSWPENIPCPSNVSEYSIQ